MGAVVEDAVGHATRTGQAATDLTAGAVSTTAVGTIAPTTSAGAAPTVTFGTGFSANDAAGTFDLNAVTGGGAQAAGEVALVTFRNPYASIPKGITIVMHNVTDTTSAIVVAPSSVTAASFKVCVGTALTTAKSYRISYRVHA